MLWSALIWKGGRKRGFSKLGLGGLAYLEKGVWGKGLLSKAREFKGPRKEKRGFFTRKGALKGKGVGF